MAYKKFDSIDFVMDEHNKDLLNVGTTFKKSENTKYIHTLKKIQEWVTEELSKVEV